MTYSNSLGNILSYEFEYNLDLNIASRIRKENNANKIEAKEKYYYDFLNNLSSYSCEGDSCPRDKNGNIIKSEDYTFDSLNNMIEFRLRKNRDSAVAQAFL